MIRSYFGQLMSSFSQIFHSIQESNHFFRYSRCGLFVLDSSGTEGEKRRTTHLPLCLQPPASLPGFWINRFTWNVGLQQWSKSWFCLSLSVSVLRYRSCCVNHSVKPIPQPPRDRWARPWPWKSKNLLGKKLIHLKSMFSSCHVYLSSVREMIKLKDLPRLCIL